MMRIPHMIFAFALLTPSVALVAEEAAQDEAAKLSAVLQNPEASLFAKRMACKDAGRRGTAASVAPLAAVLTEEALSHSARIGLQRIPGPEATAALCKALPEVRGNLLIGVLTSLGERRDPAAVADIAKFLTNDDTAVVRAGAIALGKIGDAPALAALQDGFTQADIQRKPCFVDGVFACAEHLVAEGKATEAAKVYASIRAARDLPVAVRRGAIRGELLSLGAQAGPVLEAEMLDPEVGDFLAALEAGRDLAAAELTPVLLDILPKLDAARQILLLDLLDCRADPATKDALLAKAKTEPDPGVRCAAIKALAGQPADDVVDHLLDLAAGERTEFTDAAADALTRMSRPGLDEKIVQRLGQTRGKACIPLIEVCSLRKIAGATPALIPLLNDPEYDVRLATLHALGNTVSGETIDVLIARLLAPASKTEFDTVIGSLTTVCHRTVDQDAVATKLAAAYEKAANDETRAVLIQLYGALGGTVAINAIKAAIANPAESVQDNATQVLGNWPNPEAAPVLLEVLQNPAAAKFHNRALRGYIRIVRQMDTSNEHRYNMCMTALELCKRDEEKLLLVDALARIPIPNSLEKAAEFFESPAFAETAFRSAVSLGRALQTQHRDLVAKTMQRIIDLTPDAELKRQAAEILEATKK